MHRARAARLDGGAAPLARCGARRRAGLGARQNGGFHRGLVALHPAGYLLLTLAIVRHLIAREVAPPATTPAWRGRVTCGAIPCMASRVTLPICEFVAANRERPDRLALVLVAAIMAFACCIVLLPLSEKVRVAALERFELKRWPLAAWMLFQPLPSMYNFENRWEVTTRGPGPCPERIAGFINHHVYNRIALPQGRLRFRTCQLPARVLFRSTYRGTQVEAAYLVSGDANGRGLTVTPTDGS